MSNVRDGFKVLTHDFRPPVQGGSPVWDGKRKTLDRVTLDTGPGEIPADIFDHAIIETRCVSCFARMEIPVSTLRKGIRESWA